MKRNRYTGHVASWGLEAMNVRIDSPQDDGRMVEIPLSPGNEAVILDLAYVVIHKYRGGLETTLAILDETAKSLRKLARDT